MEYAAQVDYVSLFRISMVPGVKLSEFSIYRRAIASFRKERKIRSSIFDFGYQTGTKIDFHVSFDYNLYYLRLQEEKLNCLYCPQCLFLRDRHRSRPFSRANRKRQACRKDDRVSLGTKTPTQITSPGAAWILLHFGQQGLNVYLKIRSTVIQED